MLAVFLIISAGNATKFPAIGILRTAFTAAGTLEYVGIVFLTMSVDMTSTKSILSSPSISRAEDRGAIF